MEKTYQSLHALASLRFDDAACRTLRGPYGGCRACEQACPAGVLAVDAERVALKDGCHNCGRCMAACPTGALQLEGFESTWNAPADAVEPLRIDCWKVPRRADADGLRVPCLGGLSVGRILQMWQAAGARGLFVMDRGWCGHCSAGGGERHAATRALGRAQDWLIDAGVERERLPRFVRELLPVKRMPLAIPDAALQRPVSRRNFFRAAAARAMDAAQAAKPQAAGFMPYVRGASDERSRLLAGVTAAARQTNRPLPVSLFSTAILGDDCAGHGVCARICPTAALSLKTDAADGGRTLAFDGAGCIACGSCARACPEQALRIVAAKTVPAGRIELKHWDERECEGCGEPFADGSGTALCPSCGGNQTLASDAFGALYGGAPA